MTCRAHWLLLPILAGCTRSPPPSEPTAVSVSAPPGRPAPEAPTPRSKAPVASDVPAGPWRVSYQDGSGNAFQFDGENGSASYTYSPTTAERSSSGTYSGGSPAAGKLLAEQVAALWKRLRELEARTDAHTGERGMGTGAFRIITPAGESSFIVERGAPLAELDELLLQMKLGN